MTAPPAHIAVLGGSYWEESRDPSRSEFMGSGLRAASYLRESCGSFHTWCADKERPLIEATAPHATIRSTKRDAPISFIYETPVSPPRLIGDRSHSASQGIDEDRILVFGTVEEFPVVRARAAVVDPQHSLALADLATRVSAERFAVVANQKELQTLALTTDLYDASRTVRQQAGAEVVVAKCGALGAVVFSDEGEHPVAVHPTETVFPIGSGDVFSAAFARAWLTGADPLDAATTASAATASYCGTMQLGPAEVPVVIDSMPLPSEHGLREPPLVYLASSYKTLPQRWLMRLAESALGDIGMRVFNPLREVGPAGNGQSTALADMAGITRSDSMLLLMDGAGSGVSWEAAAAQLNDKPVVAYKSDARDGDLTMITGHGGHMTSDLSTAIYHAAWHACRSAAN